MPSVLNRLIECLSKCNILIHCKSKCCKGCIDCDCDIIEGNKTPRVNSHIDPENNNINNKSTII